METRAPDTYRALLDADRASQQTFGGHGSAIAQAYNHMILPLANARDKRTQVLWGVRDFHTRFGRPPEGMWLPEAAVDLATLEAVARAGIRFTVLAPSQARRTRKIGGRAWRDEHHGAIDPSRAYELRLPSGRRMQVLFYDGPISRAVAFERLLRRGEDLAHRLVGAFADSRPWSQLVHIATDGETYGHHHPDHLKSATSAFGKHRQARVVVGEKVGNAMTFPTEPAEAAGFAGGPTRTRTWNQTVMSGRL